MSKTTGDTKMLPTDICVRVSRGSMDEADVGQSGRGAKGDTASYHISSPDRSFSVGQV